MTTFYLLGLGFCAIQVMKLIIIKKTVFFSNAMAILFIEFGFNEAMPAWLSILIFVFNLLLLALNAYIVTKRRFVACVAYFFVMLVMYLPLLLLRIIR